MKRQYTKREIRHRRIRATIAGTAARPRLAVFRSSVHLYAQLIDDEVGRTLAASNDTVVVKARGEKRTPVEIAFAVGADIARAAAGKNITRAVFDRGGYAYHGQVQALAEGARKGGLSC